MGYSVRFWNVANENISVGGKYSHDFATFDDAWEGANSLINEAWKLGAVEMDINNEFYEIVDGERSPRLPRNDGLFRTR